MNNLEPIRDLLIRTADDALIIGHRNSEWTGLGPVLEEDIAFSSMAQDKVGHALAIYVMLHERFAEPSPDELAFLREEKNFRCCHFVEFPIGEYDFTTVRHFLFDHAEALRYESFSSSSFEPLASLARKIKGELKYHVLHADVWMMRLSRGSEVSHLRMQSALNKLYPFALGIFEESNVEAELTDQKIFSGEKKLKALWHEKVSEIIDKAGLEIPEVKDDKIGFGGRQGFHTEYLHHTLEEMSQVFKLEEKVEW